MPPQMELGEDSGGGYCFFPDLSLLNQLSVTLFPKSDTVPDTSGVVFTLGFPCIR